MRRLAGDFRPVLQQLAGRCLRDVGLDDLTAGQSGLLEDGEGEGADVDGCVADGLDWGVCRGGGELQVGSGGLERVGRVHGVLVVAGVPGDPEESCLWRQGGIGLDVVVYLVLGGAMWHKVFAIGELRQVRKSGPDVVFEGLGLGGGFGHVDALRDFNVHGLFGAVLGEGFKEVSYGEDRIGTLEDVRRRVQEVGVEQCSPQRL